MALDFERIEAQLQMLREMGVSEFECEDFTVRFNDYVPSTTTTVVEHTEGVPAPRSMFENKLLWANGEPPRFPKKDV
jgi:hypothetical protein